MVAGGWRLSGSTARATELESLASSLLDQLDESRRTDSPRRAGRATPRDGTARRTPAASCAAALRPCRRTDSGASPRHRPAAIAGSTAKPWFCDVISTLPVSSFFTGWLRAAVAELQLERRAAHRQAEDLMAEADAEHRHVGRRRAPSRCRSRRSAAPDRRGRCSGTRRRARSPAAPTPASSPDRRGRRSRARSAGAGCSTSCRSRRRRSSAGASRRRSGAMPNSPGSSAGQSNASAGRDAAHQIRAFHLRNRAARARRAPADRARCRSR